MPSIICRVEHPIIAPVRARAGDLLVVTPTSAVALVVSTSDGGLSRSHAIVATALLRDLLDRWTQHAVVVPITHDDAASLRRYLSAPRPAA